MHELLTVPLVPDISGEKDAPVPRPMAGGVCACCGLDAGKRWQGMRAGHLVDHAVCTLCYLTGHLDSPTAGHGRLAWLPGLELAHAQHLQRRALLAILAGDRSQRQEGKRLWRYLVLHAREVEGAWGTARASEFAGALKRLPPSKRSRLQRGLADCVLILPPDLFDDLTLLLPRGKSPAAALTSWCRGTYIRSDLYAEPDPLG